MAGREQVTVRAGGTAAVGPRAAIVSETGRTVVLPINPAGGDRTATATPPAVVEREGTRRLPLTFVGATKPGTATLEMQVWRDDQPVDDVMAALDRLAEAGDRVTVAFAELAGWWWITEISHKVDERRLGDARPILATTRIGLQADVR